MNSTDNPIMQNATDRLGEGKILPLVFKLTIPAVIAQLITFLYNIVDRMFVAKIESSGDRKSTRLNSSHP